MRERMTTHEIRMSDGAPIVLRRLGNPKGLRLVVSHGNGLAVDAYESFWRLLSDRSDLILYDVRNHGRNPVGDLAAHTMAQLIDDTVTVAQAIDRTFGRRPRVGVFHSLAALLCLLPGAEAHGYAGLVLFDPPVAPDTDSASRLLKMKRKRVEQARQRQADFDTWEDLAGVYRSAAPFRLLPPRAVERLAQATLRARGPTGFTLCCPPAFEAKIYEESIAWSTRIDFDRIRCPVRVIGSDPVLPFSFLPSVDLNEIEKIDYDFLPDATHFLQLEKPGECALMVRDFLDTLESDRCRGATADLAGGGSETS